MTDKHDFEWTISIGERAFGHLKYNSTPAIPKYYEFWYNYASGRDKNFISTVQEALQEKEVLSVEETNKILDKFITPNETGDQVEEIGSQLSFETQKIMKLVHNAKASSSTCSESFEDIVDDLGKLTSPDQLSTVVANLVATTKDMINNNQIMENRLEKSRDQINDLNKSLERVRTEANTDQLTGIANRKRFDYFLAESIDDAQESNEHLCLLYADIDHFKKFNDTFGHLAGDQVLRLVAHTLKVNVKGADLVARYGGEEFAVVLPKTSLKNALTVAEQIRCAVMNKELVMKNSRETLGRVTLSIGAALYRNGESSEDIIQRADACLYAAKDGGRNQVKCETDADIQLDVNANAA